ncbi:hypothetical protein F3Y22_tig00110893pilonHSYRG00742 [Hibiscus syriacus]|uniref:Uncharacterized protein n=1 Tax=Hibiscus syriacus TaxID=106335 RepID=A0A6A2ZIE3_HIBSY|nr:hypothetical protein F3Y22_tig00110893pilonHSYRG00742 [Hibiscus syriacus]
MKTGLSYRTGEEDQVGRVESLVSEMCKEGGEVVEWSRDLGIGFRDISDHTISSSRRNLPIWSPIWCVTNNEFPRDQREDIGARHERISAQDTTPGHSASRRLFTVSMKAMPLSVWFGIAFIIHH